MQKNENIIRFYLDQNVIDYLIKGNLNFIKKIINQVPNSEIVYSYVTLREFSRIDHDIQRKSYLDFLKNSNAKYFWIDNDGYAYFEEVDPNEKYNELESENPVYKNLEDSMLGMMHKLFGGKKNVDFNEIAESQKVSFNELIEFINKSLDSLEDNILIDKEQFKNQTQSMNKYFIELIDKSINQIKVHSSENTLNELRKLLDINIVELNNIVPPNIIIQIWERIKDGIKRNNINLTFNDLFGDGILKYYSNQKITMTMKVNGLHNLLNSLGYYSDKGIQNDNKFFPFINDQKHVGNAIYSNYFVTRDKRLMKKTEAVYEHLKIGTQIIFIQ